MRQTFTLASTGKKISIEFGHRQVENIYEVKGGAIIMFEKHSDSEQVEVSDPFEEVVNKVEKATNANMITQQIIEKVLDDEAYKQGCNSWESFMSVVNNLRSKF